MTGDGVPEPDPSGYRTLSVEIAPDGSRAYYIDGRRVPREAYEAVYKQGPSEPGR